MQTKIIGVVIPIYNVEKYLKECLDSVINQTYTNLEIILVNDGSTDENSLNIAKEYTLKDKRITLFDKKNGGQSTARNVGIEYFSGEYKLKNKTQIIKENSLIEFNIEGNNPYEIYTIYKSYKAFNDEQDLTSFTYPIIDYIIFLDSDDYWELNCIEECVPRMDGVDVVWFDFEMFIDKEHKDINNPNWNRMRHFSLDGKISREEFEIEMIKKKLRVFAFVCDGLIDFIFFKKNKLKFFNYGYAEDHYFGLSCFLSLNNIYILRKKFYNYRVRSDSSCDFSQTYIINPNNKILFYIYKNMNYNAKEAMEYFRTYCYIETTLNIISFFETRSIKSVELFKNIIQFYYHRCRAIEQYNLDPMKIKKRLNKIFYYYSLFYEYKQLFNDKMGVIKNKDELIQNTNNLLSFQTKYGTAKTRIQNQLSYKLGQAMILNSKSILGYLIMPMALLSIIISHKQEQKIYQEKIKKDPSLKLPPLESYPDYKEALKLKNHLSYKLGEALIQANKTWYKGGYVKILFEIGKLKREC